MRYLLGGATSLAGSGSWSQLERSDVGRFAGLIEARDAALVRGGGLGIVGMDDGRTTGQQGYRLSRAAIVLQRAKVGIDHPATLAADSTRFLRWKPGFLGR
jgi:hypothetical protein